MYQVFVYGSKKFINSQVFLLSKPVIDFVIDILLAIDFYYIIYCFILKFI